jgi:hypothetical protein
MAKFTYKPWNEVVIHEIIESKPEDLFASIVRQTIASSGVGITPSVNWVDGIAFVESQFADSDEVVREKLNGVVHYSSLEFARVPEYRSEIQVNVGGGLYPIRLQKVDTNPIFVELARYLMERTPK